MNQPIRWGILGPGRIAEKFATALRSVPGNELALVASREEARARTFAAAHGCSRWVDSYEALATDTGVDIVYIATPHAFHCEQALLCLQQGKAVLCEKPMALTLAQTEKMVSTARIRQVFLMEGMWTRFMPVIQKARELIESGVIGTLEYLEADFGFANPLEPASRLFDRRLGGGSILDVGIYPVFLAAYLLGEPDAIHSFSRLAPTGVDEYCNAIFHYPGGTTAHIFSAITVPTACCCTLTGSLGKIFIPHPWYRSTEMKWTLQAGGEYYFSQAHECNGFEYEIREVADCLREGWLECPAMPLDFSLLMSKITDTLCRQAGVIY